MPGHENRPACHSSFLDKLVAIVTKLLVIELAKALGFRFVRPDDRMNGFTKKSEKYLVVAR